jgi:hypothetical protein
MKKALLLLIFAFCALNIDMISKEITVTTGAAYSEQAFYSLSTDEVLSVAKDNWDIAFETSSYDAGILLNSTRGNGMTLYYYPQSSEESWEVNLDTSGMSSTWEKCYDSEVSWSVGAFNRGKDGYNYDNGDYGWGAYNSANHHTIGYSLFVLKMYDGTFKKIMITEMFGGMFTFLVADIDGSNEKEYKVSKKDYGTKNYIYFDLKTGDVVDREPLKGAWDLLFTKYTSILNMGGTITPYSVTGVKSNKGVFVAQTGDYLIEEAPVPPDEAYTDTITAIGSDWKKFILSENKYEINDMMIYFVAAIDNMIYKIAFRDFGGSATGDFVFEKQELETSVNESNGNSSSFAIYPNIASKNEPVNLVFKSNSEFRNANIDIYSIVGTKVFSKSLDFSDNLNVYKLDIFSLSSGSYFVNLNIDGNSQVQKLLVQ